jgi:hypothetical protein
MGRQPPKHMLALQPGGPKSLNHMGIPRPDAWGRTAGRDHPFTATVGRAIWSRRLSGRCCVVIGLEGILAYPHRKTVALIAQQVQQFLISAMDRRPAHLLLHPVPQQLQLLPGHWLSLAFSRAAFSRNLIPTISPDCEARHNRTPRRSFDVSMVHASRSSHPLALFSELQ